MTMILHTILLNYRSFLRAKTTFFINLIGLSTALASTLLIYLWIQDELNFDKFHEKDDRLYQVMENIHNHDGIATRDATPFGMAELLLETLPEVEQAATVTPMAWFPKFTIDNKGNRLKHEGKFAGKDFFNIFSYPLLHGDADQVLEGKYSIVISENLAEKLYGSADSALGQVISWELSHLKQQCTVTGVFKDIPRNSSEQFELVLPIELLGEIMGFNPAEMGPIGPATFLVLKGGVNPDALNAKISSLMAEKTGEKTTDFIFVPYSKKYLYGKFENGVQVETRMRYVKLFGLLALVILFIACINFMNLTTAKASRRLKEIGIKKAIGASRKTLIIQYMGESVLMSVIALITALLMVNLLLPQFNQVTGKQLVSGFTVTDLTVYGATAIVTGILAGSYPALYLSSFRPVKVLKGYVSGSFAELMARKGLVIFQFAVSIVAIVGVLVIYQQMVYVQTRNLGYAKENLIYFELEGRVAEDNEAFLSEVKKIPGVINASAMVGNIVGTVGHGMEIKFNNKAIQFHWLGIDYEMIETLGIEMESGRTFSREFNDSARIILNQAAIDVMDISDPIGKMIPFGDDQVEIIGITRNFHLRSLHEVITPLAFRLEPDIFWNIFVRLEEGRQSETLRNLQEMYKRFNPGFALDYRFVDQTYQSQYVSENRVASLSVWFAGMAIVISCLGLFGLASYSAERRVKEIGIRKVFGSTASGIVFLLCKDFIRLVLVAVVISVPISYYLSKAWLSTFSYSINLEWWVFLLAALMSILIAVVTTAGQAVKASWINPSKCLRNE